MQFLHLIYDATSMPVVGKAWAYEGLYFQISSWQKLNIIAEKDEWLETSAVQKMGGKEPETSCTETEPLL